MRNVNEIKENLIKHIKKILPTLRENIILSLELKSQDLRNYGGYDKITDKKSQGMFILALLSKFEFEMTEKTKKIMHFNENLKQFLIRQRFVDSYEMYG